MSAAPSPANHPNALIGHIERALALRARSEGAVDPDEAQRLLKHLKRLEPAALQAMDEAATHTEGQDFQACLRSLS